MDETQVETQPQPRLKTLKNGAVYDLDKGRIVNSKNVTTKITPERAISLSRARQEKAAKALRLRITEATNKVSTVSHNSSASAIADVGGILWEEIVLNPDAYPRDRMDAFEKLGKMAQLIPDGKEKSEDPAQGASNVIHAAAELVSKITQLLHASSEPVLEGLVSETDISKSNNLRIGEPSETSPTNESEEG